MNPKLEKLLKLPLYQRLALLGVLLGLIGAGFFFMVYSPKQDEYVQLQNTYQNLQAKLQQDRRIADNLPRFRAEHENLQQQLKQALNELPNKKEIPSLLTSIAALAKDQGLDIVRFKPSGEVPKGFYAEVPVALNLVGTYHDIALFFDKVGGLPRIVNIGSLSMGSPRATEEGTVLTVDCLATTFRFIEDASNK